MPTGHAPRHRALGNTARWNALRRRATGGRTRSPLRRRPLAAVSVTAVISLVAVMLVVPTAVSAATAAKHEITATWAGTPAPTSAQYASPVNAEFHINTNDANNPKANDPVDNVRASLTVTNGVFVSIPPVCLTTGVTPVSAISPDGKTLVCNVGTVKEGTSTVIQAPVRATDLNGGSLSVSGIVTSDSAVAPAAPASTPPIPITYTYGMDLSLNNAPGSDFQSAVQPSRLGGNRQFILMNFSLILAAGSRPGPANYTFPVNVSANVAGATTGLAFENCSPVSSNSRSTGQPYSDPAQSDRTNFPTCAVTGSGTSYSVTVSNLNYTLTNVPVKDSLGQPLPQTGAYIASGTVAFSIPNAVTQVTNFNFSAAGAPAFDFGGGHVVADDQSDNTSSATVPPPGGFSDAWIGQPTYSRTPWDDNLWVSPGTSKPEATNLPGPNNNPDPKAPDFYLNTPMPLYMQAQSLLWNGYTGPGGAQLAGICTMNQNPSWFKETAMDGGGYSGGTGYEAMPTARYYYTTQPLNTKTETCGEAAPGPMWTELTPAPGTSINDPRQLGDSLVQLPPGVTAVKMTWNPAVDRPVGEVFIRAFGYIDPSAPTSGVGWTVGTFNAPGAPWQNLSQTGVGTIIPGDTYDPAHGANGQQDAYRLQGPTGTVTKTTPDTTAVPGGPVTYNLTAEADLPITNPPNQTFPVVDTLPAGMQYVPGSGTPAPVVTTNGSGQQVLTWTFTNVPANVKQNITYQAARPANSVLPPGSALTNTVVINVPGDNRLPNTSGRSASATVLVPNSSATTLGKSAEANVLSFYGDSSAWDLTINSQDPVTNPFTDTIDVLPAKGDVDGTNIDGSYTITGVTAVAGATVYYTSAPRASLSNDPRSASNGGTAGSVGGNTVGWTTTQPANPTGIRIIGPALAPGASQQIRIAFSTPAGSSCTSPAAGENKPGQKIVNTANSIAGHTALPMLSSATTTIGNCYALDLKKYVLAKGGDPSGTPGDPASDWRDANTVADYQQYVAGDTVRYAIVAKNIGTGTLTNIPVVDDHFASCNFTIASLAAGASASKQCTAIATVGATVNTASANVTPPCTGGTCPPPLTPADPAGVLVPQFPHVNKNSVPAPDAPVTAGQKITYTITVTEPATSVAPYRSPSLTDPLADVLDDATYNGDAAAHTAAGDAGTVTVDPSSHVLSWQSSLLTPGQVVTITYSVTVNNPLTGDGTLTNPVAMPHSNCDPASADPTDCVVVHKVRSFVAKKVADKTTVQPGEKITYTITVHNNGQVGYTGQDPASYSDDLSSVLDDATYNNDVTASDGSTVGYTAPKLSWSGPLAVGATTTFTYTVTVNTPDTGDKLLRNAVVGGSNCPAGSADPDCIVAIPGPVLQLKKSVNVTYADPGQKITYTIVASNIGAGDFTTAKPASFDDDLTKVLDDADYNTDAKASTGKLSYHKPTLSWTGPLKSKATVTITYTVTVHNPATGDLSMDNPVTTPPGVTSNCETGSTDPNCKTHTPIEQYEVKKTSDKTQVSAGELIHYTITITNTGKVAFTTSHPATVNDDMTQVLDDASYNTDAKASAGGLTYREPVLAWSGPLPLSASVTITYTLTVKATGSGDGKLHNVITTPTDPGGTHLANCPTGTSPGSECQTMAVMAETALASTGNDNQLQLILAGLLIGAGGLLTLVGTQRRRRTG